MKFFKLLSKFCIGIAIFLELGAILYNLKLGYSAFYLFDLSNKFSVYNNLFLIYWLAILGIVFLTMDVIKRFDFFKAIYSSLIGKESSYTVSQVKEFVKDYQILIGAIIVAFFLYQSSDSDLDTCINNTKSLYGGYGDSAVARATMECAKRLR